MVMLVPFKNVMTAIMEPPLVLHRTLLTEHPPLQWVAEKVSRISPTRETTAWQNVSRSVGVLRTAMSPPNSTWSSGNALLMVGVFDGLALGLRVGLAVELAVGL